MTNKQIVALSIDKVQSFLFETIHAHVQEKQMEAATLRNIMNSSREISVDFFRAVEEAFAELNIKELLSCSGVFIFECELSEDIIEEKLNTLFLHYYCSSQGQKQLRFVFFPAKNYDKIKAIQEAKKRLKQACCLNAVIEKNRDALFSFHPIAKPDFTLKSSVQQYSMFAENINALFSPEEADNENSFRIAVIKADLDGMGDMFKKITDYDNYRKISETLYESISLSGLHRAAEACQPDGRAAWLFPFYIAGDDIFFAVSVSNLIKGVDVCRQIVQEVNKQLCVVPSSRLSMSIGVEITFNRQPIRYYLDMVQKQLKNAKKKSCSDEVLKEFLQTKISMGGLRFFDIDINKKKETKKGLRKNSTEKASISKAETNESIWQYFLHDLKLISHIKSRDAYKEKVGTASFFYTLLEKITDEAIQGNKVKYINNLLYHLLPEYLDSPDTALRELELLLKTAIIRQLYQKGDKGEAIVISSATKRRLKTYLRFMLLFSDPRFNISQGMSQDSDHPFRTEDIKSVRKYLLTKPLDYLYDSVLRSDLRDVFVKRIDYPISRNGKITPIPCYQRLRIEKSMFFKLRDTDHVSADKAAKMIALHNSTPRADIDDANNGRLLEGKAPYHLYFDGDTFCKKAKASGTWTPDYVDSLMLFYGYNEMGIRFKGLYSKQTKGGKK